MRETSPPGDQLLADTSLHSAQFTFQLEGFLHAASEEELEAEGSFSAAGCDSTWVASVFIAPRARQKHERLNLHFIKGKSHIHVWFMVKYCDSETCRVVAWLVKVLVSPAGCHRFVSQQCVKCWANSLFNYLPCMHSYTLSTKLRIGLIVLFLQR